MSFFRDLFHTKRIKSIVLIEVSAGSVAGAYTIYVPEKEPAIVYARRLPIEVRGAEPLEQALMRTLKTLGDDLMHDGAPLLVQATGSGTVDGIFLSVDTPWQKTAVRTEQFEQNMPFLFDKRLAVAALEQSSHVPQGYVLANESIIGAVLNGYETRNPFGKEVHRASLSVLTSYIDERVLQEIRTVLRTLYHTRRVTVVSGSSLRYQAMRNVFPHERDALILDATEEHISIALIRRGLLAEILETAHHSTKGITEALTALAERFPLPRTLFLLAPEPKLAVLKKTLDATHFEKLWLSDNPPKIVSVLGSHVGGLVRQSTTTPPDISLSLMALYAAHREGRSM